jgi:hypothetical protein
MGFIARNLKNLKNSLLFEPLEIRKDNNLLRVRILDRKSVDFDAEYEMFFVHNGVEYHLHATPIDSIGNSAIFQIKDFEEHKRSRFGAIKVNVPVLLCDVASGVCVKALCEEFSLEGAKVKLEGGIDKTFLGFLEEQNFMVLVFQTPKGEFRIHGTPVEVSLPEGEIYFMFAHVEDNKKVGELYNFLLNGTTNGRSTQKI